MMNKTPTRNATELKEKATTATMKANQLKEKATTATPTNLEKSMTLSQLYATGSPLWAKDFSLEFLIYYFTAVYHINQTDLDHFMVSNLQECDEETLRNNLVKYCLETSD